MPDPRSTEGAGRSWTIHLNRPNKAIVSGPDIDPQDHVVEVVEASALEETRAELEHVRSNFDVAFETGHAAGFGEREALLARSQGLEPEEVKALLREITTPDSRRSKALKIAVYKLREMLSLGLPDEEGEDELTISLSNLPRRKPTVRLPAVDDLLDADEDDRAAPPPRGAAREIRGVEETS